MATIVINYENIVKEINEQSKAIYDKYELDKYIPFTIKAKNITVEYFLTQFDSYVDTIAKGIILQLAEYQTSLKYIKQRKELIIAYNSFTKKNQEIYDMINLSVRERDKSFLQLNTSMTLNQYQTELKLCSKEEKDSIKELESLKLEKNDLLRQRRELSYLTEVKEEKDKKCQRMLIGLIVAMIIWIIGYQLMSQ